MKLLDYLLDLSKDQPASLKFGKIVEIWFAIGCHGLKWEGTKVTDCKMQARLHGVHKGWLILAIDGEEVNSAEDVGAKLSEASTAGTPYPVVFVTDPALVRAAEAKKTMEYKEKVRIAMEKRAKSQSAKVAKPNALSASAARSWARKEDRLKRIYDMCNADGDDSVSKEELISICTINKGIALFFGIPRDLADEQLDRALESFFQSADADGDGSMTWEELLSFYKKQTLGDPAERQKWRKKFFGSAAHWTSLRQKRLREIFDKCDAGAAGQITKNALIRAIKRDEAIAEFFHLPKKFKMADEIEALRDFQIRVDSNGDGLLSWEEFKSFDKFERQQRQLEERKQARRQTLKRQALGTTCDPCPDSEH